MVFISLGVLDYVSHWAQMYSTLLSGEESHKNVQNRFLQLYYKSRLVLFCLCMFQETTLLSLYAVAYKDALGQAVGNAALGIFYVSAPFCAIKQIVNVVQLKL